MTTLVLAAQAAQGGGSMGGMLIMMVAIFAIMWFFMIRPQQKRQKKIREFQNALQEGAKVVLGGGIYGTVRHIDQQKNTVDVEVARGVVVTVDKGYVFADVAQQQPNA
jgi:preprotein translocase subunit YajC